MAIDRHFPLQLGTKQSIHNPAGYLIARTFSTSEDTLSCSTQKEAREMAAFLVNSANNQFELIQALETALDMRRNAEGVSCAAVKAFAEKAEALIQKVRG